MTDRERFEKFAKGEGYILQKRRGQYLYSAAATAWKAWQAALSSRIDVALSAPMTLDLREDCATLEDWMQDSDVQIHDQFVRLSAIRQQLPNVKIITDKETP